MPEKKLLRQLRKDLSQERDAKERTRIETEIVLLILLVELKTAVARIDDFLNERRADL